MVRSQPHFDICPELHIRVTAKATEETIQKLLHQVQSVPLGLQLTSGRSYGLKEGGFLCTIWWQCFQGAVQSNGTVPSPRKELGLRRRTRKVSHNKNSIEGFWVPDTHPGRGMFLLELLPSILDFFRTRVINKSSSEVFMESVSVCLCSELTFCIFSLQLQPISRKELNFPYYWGQNCEHRTCQEKICFVRFIFEGCFFKRESRASSWMNEWESEGGRESWTHGHRQFVISYDYFFVSAPIPLSFFPSLFVSPSLVLSWTFKMLEASTWKLCWIFTGWTQQWLRRTFVWFLEKSTDSWAIDRLIFVPRYHLSSSKKSKRELWKCWQQ